MKPRCVLPLVVLILFASAVLGVIRMRDLSFWFDEVASIDFTRDLIGTLQRFPDQMPAYFVMLRGWLALVGQSEVAGRWLSLLFGLLALAFTFQIARRYASTRIAILSLIALASSAVFVRYFREMRTYTFLACLGAASTWFYLEWRRCGRRRDAIAYVVLSGVMVYTHFFAGLLLAAQGLYTLLTMRWGAWRPRFHLQPDRRDVITIGMHALVGALLLPYFGLYLSGLNWVTNGGKHPAALTTPQALDSMARGLTNDSLALFVVLLLLALATRYRRMLGVALAWLVIPVLAVFAVHAFVIPVFVNPRYLLFVWPALAILVALGIDTLNRRAALVAVSVVALVGVGQVINNLPSTLPGVLVDHPWREMFSTIGADARPTDLVLTNMVDLVGLSGFRDPIFYYFNRYTPPGMSRLVELDVQPYPTDLAARMAKATGAWLVVTDGDPNVRGQEAIRLMRQAGYADCRTWPYDHQTALTEWQHVIGPFFEFGQQIRLQRTPLNLTPTGYHPGDPIDLALGFSAIQTPPINYSIGLYVIDANGQVTLQQDGPPANSQTSTWRPGNTFCDVHHLVAPKTPGAYQVRVAVYDSGSSKRLPVNPPDGNSDSALLLTFNVESS